MKPPRAPVRSFAAEAAARGDVPAPSPSSRASARRPRSNFPVRIFAGTTVDGAEVAFVSLADDRCAFHCDGVLRAAWAADACGIDDGVRQYLELIQHQPLGNAPPPVEAKRLTTFTLAATASAAGLAAAQAPRRTSGGSR